MLNVVYGQQVNRVKGADVVVAGLEFTGDLPDEDTGILDLDHLSIAKTAKDGESGVRIGVNSHNAPIVGNGCEIANPELESLSQYICIIT